MQDRKRYQEEYEELNIKDLIWSVLCRWRILAAAFLAGGILLAAFTAWKDYRALSSEKTMKERQLAYEASRDAYAAQKELLENELKTFRDTQERQQYYRNNALMLKMDPYNVSFIEASFRVEWDTQEHDPQDIAYASAVLRLYQSALDQLDLDAVIADAENPDLTADNPAGTERRMLEASTDYVNAVLTLKIYADSAERAEKIYSAAGEAIKAQHEVLERNTGAHQLVAVGERRWTGADAELVSVQTEFRNNMTAVSGFIAEDEKSLSALKAPQNTVPTTKSMIRKAVKYGVAGAFGGLLLAAAFLMIRIVLEDRLNNTEEIAERYGLPVLGTLGSGKKAGKADRSIAGKLGADPGRSVSEAAEFIAANVRLHMKEGGKLVLVGTCGGEKLNALKETLAPLLEGVAVTAAGNVNESAAAVGALKENDAVICAEEWKKAPHKAIRRELQTVEDSGTRNLGVIVLC